MGRFIILTGPSCVGKGPLCAALERFFPLLYEGLHETLLYNDRPPRPGERDGVDYRFRPRAEIESLRSRKDFAVLEVRGDLQAADLGELRRLLAAGDAFFEGNPFVAQLLLREARAAGVETLSVFLSPLSRDEIVDLRSREVAMEAFVAEVMHRKLRARMLRVKGAISPEGAAEIERRATSAWGEMGLAWRFDYVLPNHDGEDSGNWDVLAHPIADARRVLFAFVDLLEGRTPDMAEKWSEGFPV